MLYAIKEMSSGFFVSDTHAADLDHDFRWAELDPYRRKLFTKEQAEILLKEIAQDESETRKFSICKLQFKEISRYSIDRGKAKCVRNPRMKYILLDPNTDKYIGNGLKQEADPYNAKLFATPRIARDWVVKTGNIKKNQHLIVLQMGLIEAEKEGAAS